MKFSALALSITGWCLACAADTGRRQHAGTAGDASSSNPGSRDVTFTDVTRQVGIRFKHDFGGGKLDNILKTSSAGGGFADYDGDGDLDVFLVNGAHLNGDGSLAAGPQPRSTLLNNDGGRFTDVTETAGLTKPGYGMGCAFADYDSDGDLDLYVTNYGPNVLYRNNGNGTFADVTAQAGVGDPHWSASAAFGDMDNDGDLDLYVTNYLDFRPDMLGVHASALSKREGFRFFPGPREYEGVRDTLYRNNGDGTFTEVTEQAGLLPNGKGLGVVWTDLDDDGFADIFVANDKSPNFLYRNKHDGTFEEMAMRAGVAVGEDGESAAGMGIDVADYDLDGRQDVFVTNMVFEYNSLYHNEGSFNFRDLAYQANVALDAYAVVGFGTFFFDFDLDGWDDLFVLNGHVVDYIDSMSQAMSYRQSPFLYRNLGNGKFENVGKQSGSCLVKKIVGRAAIVGDYDNDGDPDMLVTVSNDHAMLWRNDGNTGHHFLTVDVRGPHGNRNGLGAKVTLVAGDLRHTKEVRAQRSYLASCDPRVAFGLGMHTKVDRLEVVWPGGKKVVTDNPSVDQIITIWDDGKVERATAMP